MTWPDVEGGIRDYLRANTAIAALVGTRVFFGIPATVQYPLITVQRVGGGDDTSEAPIDQALIQIDVWAAVGNKASATAVLNAVRDCLSGIRGRTTLKAGVTGFGAEVVSVIWAPEQGTDQPRYSVTAAVAAIAA